LKTNERYESRQGKAGNDKADNGKAGKPLPANVIISLVGGAGHELFLD